MVPVLNDCEHGRSFVPIIRISECYRPITVPARLNLLVVIRARVPSFFPLWVARGEGCLENSNLALDVRPSLGQNYLLSLHL